MNNSLSPTSLGRLKEICTQAVVRLQKGEVIAYPTETVFGLAVLPQNAEAVEQLLRLKSRAFASGVSLILSSAEEAESWVEDSSSDIAARRRELTAQFWPGPLTLVIAINAQARLRLAQGLLGPDDSLAIRVSSCLEAGLLAEAAGGAITTTSANPHSMPPAKSAQEAASYFPGMFVVPCLSLPGASKPSLPSTIIDVRTWPFQILREGAINRVLLEQIGN